MFRKRRVSHQLNPTHISKKPLDVLKRFVFSFKPSNFKEYWLSKHGLLVLGKMFGIGLLLIFLTLLWYAKDLPSPDKINAKISAGTTKFYDRTGKTVLYEVYGTKNRNIIEFKQMPNNIKQATIAIEDKNFYRHGAFSAFSIFRAAFQNFFSFGHGRMVGGSTITQQLVKNALLTSNRTISRKIKEVMLAVLIEQFYKKDDILKMYLNEISYGTNAYGIQAAAKTYFNKNASDLTLDEAALLASIPQAPTYYSPYGQHKNALITRQHIVLDQMVDQKYITKAQADQAKAVNVLAKVPPTPKYFSNIIAPHFVLYVKEQLEAQLGSATVDEGGLSVVTTLDLTKQSQAEAAITEDIGTIRALGGSNAALVSADPKTGQILAMVGSYNFSDPSFGSYNVAIANRQPGSSFKPIVYSTAYGQNYGPGTTIYDVRTDFGGGYIPKNYNGRFSGVQSMRTSLAGSLNIPAVKTLYMAGIQNALNQAHNMGITTLNNPPDQYGLSLVLGSGEVKLADMVNAYESFANTGLHYSQVSVLKITGPGNKVIQEYKPVTNPKRVLDPQVAYLISNVLSDNKARTFIFGSNSPLVLSGRPAAVKTGTTQYWNDAWTIGYTPSLVTGVWVGNNDNSPMSDEAVNIAAPIWHDFMTNALAGTAVEQFTQPAGIKQVTLDANTGKLPTSDSKAKRTDIFPSWYKPQDPSAVATANIDRVSGKLATSCTPQNAIQTVKSGLMQAEIPATDPAFPRWNAPVQALAAAMGISSGGAIPTASDDVHKCSDKKPTIDTLAATDNGNGTIHVKIKWTSGTFPVNKLDVYLGSSRISTGNPSSDPYEFDTPVSPGTYTVKAIVTDTALYITESSTSVKVAAGFSNISPCNTTISSNPVTFSWSLDPGGATKYYFYASRNNIHFSPYPIDVGNNTSYTKSLSAGSYSWYIEAGTHKTTACSFTKN